MKSAECHAGRVEDLNPWTRRLRVVDRCTIKIAGSIQRGRQAGDLAQHAAVPKGEPPS